MTEIKTTYTVKAVSIKIKGFLYGIKVCSIISLILFSICFLLAYATVGLPLGLFGATAGILNLVLGPFFFINSIYKINCPVCKKTSYKPLKNPETKVECNACNATLMVQKV